MLRNKQVVQENILGYRYKLEVSSKYMMFKIDDHL